MQVHDPVQEKDLVPEHVQAPDTPETPRNNCNSVQPISTPRAPKRMIIREAFERAASFSSKFVLLLLGLFVYSLLSLDLMFAFIFS